jgi:hypothetical protein
MRPISYFAGRYPVRAGKKTKVLPHREIRVKAELLWYVPETRPDSKSIFPDIQIPDCTEAGRWLGQPAKHANRRCFTCTVGPQKTEDLTPLDRNRNSVDGFFFAKPLREVLQDDERFRHEIAKTTPGFWSLLEMDTSEFLPRSKLC